MQRLKLKSDTGNIWRDVWKQRSLQLMVIAGMIWLILFAYIPMLGIIISFQDFDIFKGIAGSKFVGWTQYREMVEDDVFWLALRNSFFFSVVKLAIMFALPIFFAILLNEIYQSWFKKIVQTITYLPHFISYVIVAGIFTIWLDAGGLINQWLVGLHILQEPYSFLLSSKGFWVIMSIIDSWKETGWGAIIYLAVIAGIPQEMYEAATVDGAGRIQKIMRITLPYMKPTIVILFILSMGGLLSGGGSNFNESLLFGNSLNYDTSRILDTYVVNAGLELGRYSYATAIGVVYSMLSLFFFVSSNWVLKKAGQESLY